MTFRNEPRPSGSGQAPPSLTVAARSTCVKNSLNESAPNFLHAGFFFLLAILFVVPLLDVIFLDVVLFDISLLVAGLVRVLLAIAAATAQGSGGEDYHQQPGHQLLHGVSPERLLPRQFQQGLGLL